MEQLMWQCSTKKEMFEGEITKESNPIVAFAIEFADNYEDEKTSMNRFTEEQYVERVDKLLTHMKDILLNKNRVSNVDRDSDGWKINTSETNQNQSVVRLWNQKIAKELFRTVLNDTNKGI